MIKQSDRVLAEELVKRGILTQKSVDQFLQVIKPSQENLRDYLIRNRHVSESQVLDALSSGLKLDTFNIKSVKVDPSVIEKVPVRIAWYYRIMPVKIDNGILTMASTSPLDVKVMDEIRLHLGLEPKVVLAREEDIMDAINRYYGLAADTIDRLSKETKDKPGKDESSLWVEDLEKQADEASVSKLVNQILLEAHKKRATDIHIEPYRKKVRVRYRIDGVLVDANIPAGVRPFMASIISRIKILANLSIVEKRLPQDGSTVVKTSEQDLDLRISTIPTPRGESMVIRILPSRVMLLSLEKLGFEPDNLRLFRELIQKPHGIILVTGPTGSGKSTTLYASLNEVNSADMKIITIEDPVEYEMEGITQIQVNPKVELTFAAGLRSVLRHDPDIIMVGEIRDLETVEIAIRTALTGHLVFSTLHTNDAASGVTRLVEMGLEPFLVASSIEAFVAQRLVRVICPHCKYQVSDVPKELVAEIMHSINCLPQDIKVYEGKGCDHCNQTGYYGRTAIYEILAINDEIRTAILAKQRADHIKKIAVRSGMRTLRQDGWLKVLKGMTTPAEVVNASVRDEDPASAYETAGVGSSREKVVATDILAAKNEYDSRVYQRVDARIPVRYAVVRQDNSDPKRLTFDRVEHSSMTKDISAGGLRFISGYTLPVGTILELKMQLEPGQRSIDCLAKICRVEDDSLSAMFHLVAYYLDISSADRAQIDQYVQKQIKNQNSQRPTS